MSSPSYQELKELYDAGKATDAQSDCFVAPRPSEELYDMRKDKDQMNNLAGNPEYASALEEMRGVLKRWQMETCDDMPDNLTPDVFLREFIPSKRWVRDDIPGNELIKESRCQQPGLVKGSVTCINPGTF